MKWTHVLFAGFLIILRTAASQADAAMPSIGMSESAYEKLFPYYTMSCIAGQTKKSDNTESKNWGHQLMYIKGACQDKTAGHPKIKLCEEGDPDASSSDRGVVISLDGSLKNTLFVATQGKELMLNAGVSPDEPLNQETLDRVMKKIEDSSAADGLVVGEGLFKDKPENKTRKQWIIHQFIPTDWAVSLGRNALCLRIPMNQAQIAAEVEYLDAINEPYVSGKDHFEWTELGTNCTTLVHNTLHAIGLRDEITDEQSKVKSYLSIFKEAVKTELPIPANDLLNTEETVNQLKKIDSAEAVFANEGDRKIFEKFRTLPQASPTTVESLAGHTYKNDFFTPLKIRWFEIAKLHRNQNKMDSRLADSEYSTVQGSLDRVLKRLQEVQSNRKTYDEGDNSDLAVFAHQYNDWVDRRIAELQNLKGEIEKLTP